MRAGVAAVLGQYLERGCVVDALVLVQTVVLDRATAVAQMMFAVTVVEGDRHSAQRLCADSGPSAVVPFGSSRVSERAAPLRKLAGPACLSVPRDSWDAHARAPRPP